MKTIRSFLLLAGMFISLQWLHAQTTPQGLQLLPPGQGLPAGTYWLISPGLKTGFNLLPCPPLPAFNQFPYAVYAMTDGIYLVDDTSKTGGLNATALDAEANAVVDIIAEAVAVRTIHATSRFAVSSSMFASSLASTYAYGNPVYLLDMVASIAGDGSTTASFSISGGTNFVPYDILMSTNIVTPVSNWTWIGIGYTSNNYTFYEQPADNAFYILAKPSKTMTVGWGGDIYGQCDVPWGITNLLMVAAGYGYSLGLLNNGTVIGWGNSVAAGWVPTNLVNNVSMVGVGWDHNVALLTNGMVQAWGTNVLGVLDIPANLTNVTVISVQALNTLALRNDGTVAAWGYDGSGQCDVPAGLTNVTAIAAGGSHSLAVSNGFVVAWGWNQYGQTNVPAGLSNVWDVAGGWAHSVALKKDGTVVCWGDDTYGERDVPAGLSNVVAIAAGGYPYVDDPYMGNALPYSLALKSDGTVVAWGAGTVLNSIQGLNNVISISGGLFHALAIRTGPPTPVITLEPTDQYQIVSNNVTFTARGAGLYGVTYQWQTNNVNLAGATNASLTLTNVQTSQQGAYDVVVTDNGGMGSLVSSNANLYVVTPPVINFQTYDSSSYLTNLLVLYNSSVTLSVAASAPGEFNGFPLSYHWQFNGANLSVTTSNYTFTAVNSGTYSVIVSNAAGSVTAVWQVNVIYPGAVILWGSNSNGQLNANSQLTNVISLAAGKAHGVVALDSGIATNWGSYWTGTNFIPVVAPPQLTNAMAVAAGSRHDLALKTDGTVIAWGLNDFGQTNVPANATNVIAIAAGGQESLALLQNGMVVQWGQTNAAIPAGLTNMTAIAAGTNFSLALLQNSTVVAWGLNNYGQTNIPVGLSNVVAIAAGGAHALALKIDGTVTAWGAWTNVPAGLSNVMNVAAGENHSIALKNDGTVVCWGDNTFGQTNVMSGLSPVKLIAGGGDFTLVSEFSPTVMYSVNVTKDLLLIYNTNSVDSATVLNYYLAHRPGVSGANTLGIGFTGFFITNFDGGGNWVSLTNVTAYETISPAGFTNQILNPVLNWLAANPTKRPQYLVMMLDVPSRIYDTATNVANFPFYPGNNPNYSSVSYTLATNVVGWQPFITHLNMNGTNDCIGYIKKIASLGNTIPGSGLVLSASASGYGNTNYAIDDIRTADYTSQNVVSLTTNGLLAAGVSTQAITYVTGIEGSSPPPHIASSTNVAGYISWGFHSSLGSQYAINGVVQWRGNSGWWLIRTEESYNGQRYVAASGNFIEWYSSNAFGGTNYSNTPVGAVSYPDEPLASATDNSAYFGLWASGKNFGICAWVSRVTTHLQPVGDPFVTK